MSNVIVIGASGKKNAGKDTFLAAVASEAQRLGYDVFTRSPGDRVREELADIMADEFDSHPAHYGKTWAERRAMAIEWMRVNGPMKEKLRLLQQAWGLFRREFFDEEYFLADFTAFHDQLVEKGAPAVLFNPSVRFPNEADLIHRLGGLVVRVEASYPGYVDDGDAVATETAMDGYDGFDHTYHNFLSAEYFQDLARCWAREFLASRFMRTHVCMSGSSETS